MEIDKKENQNTETEFKITPTSVFQEIKNFFANIFDIHQETDKNATIESIKSDIAFRGHTSWILICSIVIASLGLNANSTAVIIGAMLISPLMGPILGIALSLAINDVDLLRRAVKNFGVMVGLSVTSAFLFFWIFPLRDTSSELLARTSPDIRDVLIAFFGGLALVIARMKKGTIASVIFGVAIATALMPPLCTVGFFLAIGEWTLSLGALYLFLINTIFIAMATFLVLRFIRLPMVVYANSSKRKMISRVAYVCATLVMIPAAYTFYQVWEISKFKNDATSFIEKSIEKYEFTNGGRFLKDLSKIDFNSGSPYIELVFFGDAPIPEDVEKLWNNQKNDYTYLKNAKLQIINNNKQEDQIGYIQELYQTNKKELSSSQEKIKLLENQLNRLQKFNREAMKFHSISDEISINYDVVGVCFANELQNNFTQIDTIPTFRIHWKEELSTQEKAIQQEKLKQWLLARLNTDKIIVKDN